ncbi:uncharacterized protein LOC117181042 [Belonocnema kinseyi]|uniref:uncharacterized protein LOC117181042 n=1 Tax=Belonocnema kinseyi TaxID=2817044 RepID=UPI00143CD013|nr:uncharacterized protein LOC117181042 [Belonocnema kinseyi]
MVSASASDKGKKLSVDSRPYVPIRKQLEQQQGIPRAQLLHQILQGQQVLQTRQEMVPQQKMRQKEAREQEEKQNKERREKEIELRQINTHVIPRVQRQLSERREEQANKIINKQYVNTFFEAQEACVRRSRRYEDNFYWKCKNLNPEFQEHLFSVKELTEYYCIQGTPGKYLCDCKKLEDKCLMDQTCRVFPTKSLGFASIKRARLMGELGLHEQLNQENQFNHDQLVPYNSHQVLNNPGPSNIQLHPSLPGPSYMHSLHNNQGYNNNQQHNGPW